MRIFYFLLFFCFATLSASAYTSVELRKSSQGYDGKAELERSTDNSVEASLDDNILTLNFSSESCSYYVVYDSSSSTIICSGSFPADTEVSFTLPSTLPSGTYVLSVYAFGCWWTGEFVYPE